MMYNLTKKLLFRLDAEWVHEQGLRVIPWLAARAPATWCHHDPRLHAKVAGVDYPNPVGLAAGFDKDGKVASSLPAFGFGAIELGTITPEPQPGQTKPRLFRIPSHAALLNRMGFNNDGAEVMAKRLEGTQALRVPLGINIGKNKLTSNENAAKDYAKACEILAGYSDYMVVNVSSPNTPGLRALQDRGALLEILSAIAPYSQGKPIWLKVAPDLEAPALEEAVGVVLESGSAGLIVGNTTLERFDLPKRWHHEAGGLSGRPLKGKAEVALKIVAQAAEGRCGIIAVGGIESSADVIHRLSLGADLVQVYSAWIYQGPAFVGKVLRELSAFMDREGLTRLSEIKGSTF